MPAAIVNRVGTSSASAIPSSRSVVGGRPGRQIPQLVRELLRRVVDTVQHPGPFADLPPRSGSGSVRGCRAAATPPRELAEPTVLQLLS